MEEEEAEEEEQFDREAVVQLAELSTCDTMGEAK